VQRPSDEFSFSLVRASKMMGSLLDVARFLDVEPKQVYWWIAGLEHPSDARRYELESRLRAVLVACRND